MNRLRAALAALLLALPLASLAQAWPSKPVKIIVPWSPGGAVDVVTRKVAQKLAEQTGQPFIVENKPGATGTIGSLQVAKSAPDGYTLLANDMAYSLLPHVFASLPWDHEKDLVPVTTMMDAPYGIAVRADGPYKTLAALLAAAKASPGKLTFGSGGNGTGPHFAGELLMIASGTEITHIPYKGAADAMTGLIGGQVDILLASTASLLAQAKGGKARILAVSGDRRLAVIADVPTFAEAGLKDYGILNFNGLWAPRGTPPAVIERLQAETLKAIAAPDVKAFFESQGGIAGGATSAQFAKRVQDTTRMWGPVAARARIEKQ
jgi:tripartite-type tricarboxylate transporter receptor subunit TctC